MLPMPFLYGLEYEILVLVANAQMSLIKTNADVSSNRRSLNFGLSPHHIITLCMLASKGLAGLCISLLLRSYNLTFRLL